MVEVRKREKETTGSLLRRFTRKVQQSRILLEARTHAHRMRPKSKTKKHKDALRREAKRKEYERLRKLGKVV
ncbi:MAG: 30S ribosomal protein S21 [Candidatus Ryanbacteria bacterium]|nr:30S ribosomal protein S21 [Candidatus Ryanbacteria bacterium]